MEENIAEKRAALSGKAADILNARTLASAHRRLLEILSEGMTVLDVGCGTGAITYGIAEIVGPTGHAIGVDNNPELIALARKRYEGVPGLHFEVGDLLNLGYTNAFDIVTSARVLQWLNEPLRALQAMKGMIKPGGKLIILDYNHEKIIWEPTVVPSMGRFYDAFLQWRADAGMHNAIADDLANFFHQIDMADVHVSKQHEKTTREDPDFLTKIQMWADVAASRGLQMVKDGYVTEEARAQAERDYRKWMEDEAVSQKLYLLAVEGTKR